MRNSLTELAKGRPPLPPPPNTDEVNEAELPGGIGTPLTDAAARSDRLLGEIIELYRRIGDQPFEWYRWKTTTDAILGNSFTHPRTHMFEYLVENGDLEHAAQIFEDAAPHMTESTETPAVHATALYNLACARVLQMRLDDAIGSLAEAMRLRPELKQLAQTDSDLDRVRDDPRFQELVKS